MSQPTHTARPRTVASAVVAARLSDAEAKQVGWIAMIIAVVGAFEVGAVVLALGGSTDTGTPAATTTMRLRRRRTELN
jgi:hypothetical protein